MRHYLKGAKSFSQQAYALLQSIQSSTQEGQIYYWLVDTDHSAQIGAEVISILSHTLNYKTDAFYLDASHMHFGSSLKALAEQRPGIYLMTTETYASLNQALSLLEEKTMSFSVGASSTPQKIKKKLVDLGYTNHEEDTFSYTAKGESILIQQNQMTHRLLFDFDKIESIKNVETGEVVKQLDVLPAEIDLTQLSALDNKRPYGIEVYSDQLNFKSEQRNKTIVFQTFSGSNEKEDQVEEYRLEFAEKYRRDFQKLALDLGHFIDHGYAITIATIDKQVIKTALQDDEIDFEKIDFVEQEIPIEGFIDRKEQFVLLSHAEVFGRKEVKKQKRRDHAAFVTKLEINDYIVHEDHGIGRYLGLTTTEIEGFKRENIVLEYAKGDKLYVPVELAYKVDKYIGEAKPKLQRLSGTSWIRLSRKATQESQEFARDLLKLYAQRSLITVPSWNVYLDADQALHKSFPFEETPDQEQAINDVYGDLQKPTPMDRLVVGDVGFGKTEVAIRAAYQAVLNHKQVAVLCPTTLLAQQHYDTFSKRLKGMGVNIEMLSRFTGKLGKEKTSVKQVVEGVKNGSINIVIGTHRLLSKDVDFDHMGLVIVDEEQRFGVRHKEKLKSLRSHVHILTLSATPIPRTLYFSLSGLRDISTIQTPPKGRQPIETKIHEYSQDLVKKTIASELKRGGQAFYLYNRVQTITTMKRKLQELLGGNVKIDIVHGQMPPTEMARVAAEFGAGKTDVLVCTTIVENGLDLPNVNTLIVHNATRYGIGQLYQIRGRIGRGTVKAHALFLYPESGISGVAATRLQILEEAKELGSGFQLAMRDLEMRGMGQMLGQKQHGQIQKVGLSLYGKLLRQAVEELETGEIQQPQAVININLPINYGLPQGLGLEPEERLKLYRLVSQALSEEEIHELLHQYREQVEQLDVQEKEELDNFIALLGLKFKAAKTPITGIDYQQLLRPDGGMKKQIELTFSKLQPYYIDLLIPYIPDFKVIGDNKIIYPVHDDLSHLGQIGDILDAFAAKVE